VTASRGNPSVAGTRYEIGYPAGANFRRLAALRHYQSPISNHAERKKVPFGLCLQDPIIWSSMAEKIERLPGS
jgi:hypothetical protein